jgi:NAD(P)-dependent dehydrogenase (short-subunit alcohol dehydrogenase family)
MSKRFEGKVVLVTGGTSGIGLAAAKLFRDEGGIVTVTGRNPATLEAAKAALGADVDVVRAESGDEAATEALIAGIGRKHGRLDVLFLNAGAVFGGALDALSAATFDEAFRVNVRGPWLTLKHATPLLAAGAAVVFNGSIMGHVGWPGSGPYSASKAAVRSIARTAAAELAPKGVRVNVLSPGPTDTGIIEKTRDAQAAAAVKDALAGRIPLKRLATSEEMARSALFLASDDSAFMTGEEIVVDGGLTRQLA